MLRAFLNICLAEPSMIYFIAKTLLAQSYISLTNLELSGRRGTLEGWLETAWWRLYGQTVRIGPRPLEIWPQGDR